MKKLFLLVSLMVSPYLHAAGWTEASTIKSIVTNTGVLGFTFIGLTNGSVDPNIESCDDNSLISFDFSSGSSLGMDTLLTAKLENVNVRFYIDGCTFSDDGVLSYPKSNVLLIN